MSFVRATTARLVAWFATGPDRPLLGDQTEVARRYRRARASVFFSVTLGYGLFYTCRVNLAAAKPRLLDEGLFDATQLGLIGSSLLGVYAVGKLVNGVLADHANIRSLMATGLLLSALLNLALGGTTWFWLFAVLWGLNGWAQATGSAPSVASLAQWFSRRELGTRYGFWSVSHSLGEGLTYVATTALIAAVGWRGGFWGPGLLCLLAALVLYRTLADRPQTYGLPAVTDQVLARTAPEDRRAHAASRSSASALPHEDPPRTHPTGQPTAAGAASSGRQSLLRLQRSLLRRPAIWVLGLSSALIYVARYGVGGWGLLFLEKAKGYAPLDAGWVMGVYPVLGLAGAMAAGLLSDRLFGSRRRVPVLLYGALHLGGLTAIFLIPPGRPGLDALAFGVFGFAMNGLLVFTGGLMAVDRAPPGTAGAAMGLIGLFSYLGAALQDTVSGVLIDLGRPPLAAETVVSPGAWDFFPVFAFYLVSSVVALALAGSLHDPRGGPDGEQGRRGTQPA